MLSAIRPLRFQAEAPPCTLNIDGLETDWPRAAYSAFNRADITNPGQGICNREDCALGVWHTTGPLSLVLGIV